MSSSRSTQTIHPKYGLGEAWLKKERKQTWHEKSRGEKTPKITEGR